VVQDGPLYTVFHYRQPIRNAVVEEDVRVYRTIRRIDFAVALKNWDGTLYREYRMALPLNIADARVAYEVPFGKVEIGKDELKQPAGQIYMTLPRDIHPRGLENWMSASGKDLGVTLSSPVAAFDFLDPTGLAPNTTLLQPILLASRKSCHSEGNEYLQTGDHYYSFSLTTHAPGWESCTRFGRQANEPLSVVVGPEQTVGASLSERESFVSVDKDNVVITTMKKAEDDDGVVLRFYETEGKDTDVEFSFKRSIKKAYSTSLIEDNPREILSDGRRLRFNLKHNSIETIKIYWQ
jgi:alpha-mannosidase